MKGLHSYPKIFNVGHPAVRDFFSAPVLVEEKVDGSQFSFGMVDGELKMRSKGKEIFVESPEKMFEKAVDTAFALAREGKLKDGWTYRGEYLQKPKHNALAYDRIPRDHIILFDVNTDDEVYLSRDEKEREAERIGLEIVPAMKVGMVQDLAEFESVLNTVSCLGGQKIEGVVCKQVECTKFGEDKKALMAKWVSSDFREVHKGNWRLDNPTKGDIEEMLISRYRTPARWNKAAQHLREAGRLESSPKDIGELLKECKRDIEQECRAEIAEALVSHFLPKVLRGATAGLPEWYKDQLLKSQFEKEDAA